MSGDLQLVLLGEARYTALELFARADIDPELVRRFWRALGYTDVPDDDRIFTDADLRALETMARFMQSGVSDEVTVQQARVYGSSLARIAEATVTSIEARVEEMSLSREQALEVVTDLMRERMPDWDWLVAYVFHRQLLAALRRSDLWADPDRQASGTLCVGFADLVGFTALSQALDEQELAAVVSRFENLAYDTIGHLGGRVVKMIGDEVMFVADDVRVAAEIALTLAETYARDETISAVRVGLASGPVLAHEGDYFGPVVNLASRIVNIAYPGTVVAAEDVYEALQGDPAFGWKPIRPRWLKGIGMTRLWLLTRPGDGSVLTTELARRMRALARR